MGRWYKRDGAAFIQGTMGLSLEEKGAYSICLDLIYSNGGPIADDARWLSGVCGVSIRKWTAIRQNLIDRGKLYADGGLLMNARAEREIADLAGSHNEAVENGSKGGRQRAENAAKSRETAPKSPRNDDENEPPPNNNNGLGQANKTREDKNREEDKEGSAAAPRQADLLDLGDAPPQKPPTVAEIVPIDPLERARDAYNATVREVNARFGAAWSECNGLSDTRRKKLTLRLKECGGVQGWVEAMSRAADSPHLNGTAPRRAEYASWWPDFDFFLQAKSFTRLLEGSYDAKPGKASDGSGGSFLEAAGRVAARDTAGGP